jgi:hypothetical protein
MAVDKQCSLSASILFSLIGLVLGICIFILLELFTEVVTLCTQRQHGPQLNIGCEHESYTPDTPFYSLAKYTHRPALTTVETMPGYALSDMDRDIKAQTVDCQYLRDFEAAIARIRQ